VPGGHLVNDDAKAPDIGAGIDREAVTLFRRHVSLRADDDAVRSVGANERAWKLGTCPGGNTEVDDLDQAVGTQHDVIGLDVAVDDTCLVCGRQAISDLQRNGDELA
jgi:hypothetical protein